MPKSEKIIFLDFDGVIITHRSHFAFNDRFFTPREAGGFSDLDTVTCNFLRRMCKYRDIKIVISSTWRVNEDKCFDRLAAAGLLKYLYKEDWKTIQSGDKRGIQIKEYLDRHPEIKEYRILDDDSDMLEEQLPFFIHCDGYNGLSYQNMKDLMVWTKANACFVKNILTKK